jgi:3-isopropylmalate dehydrogenase
MDRANPFAAILTAGMMLEHTGLGEAARAIEQAVIDCLGAGEATVDVGGDLGTAGVGDSVARRVRRQLAE